MRERVSEYASRRVCEKAHTRLLAYSPTLILLLAAALRLFMLQDVPPGLHQDEVLDADIALFIRQGQHALFFREGYGHEPLYHYLAAPFAPLLGDNVLAVRLPSVFLGLLLVALTMRWARREFGPLPALVAGLLLAVSWWPIIFSRIGIRPVLLPVLLMLAFWFWRLPAARGDTSQFEEPPVARSLRRWAGGLSVPGARRSCLAGFFLGLTLYSYTAARVLFLIPAAYFLYLLLFRSRAGPQQLVNTAVILLVTALVSLPLYVTLRADPNLQQRVEQLEEPLVTLRQGDAGPVLALTRDTLAGFTFAGDPRWTYNIPGRPFFDWLTGLLFYGGVLLALLGARREPRYAFLLIWLGAGLLPSAVTPDAPSSVRLVGAMPVIYLLPGLAVQALSRRIGSRDTRISGTLFAMGLLAVLFSLNLGRTLRDGFIAWPAAVETGVRYQSHFLDVARHWQNNATGTPVIADSWYEPIDHDSVRRSLGHDLPARWIQAGRALVFPVEGDGRLYLPEFVTVDPRLLELTAMASPPLIQSTRRPALIVYELPAEPSLPMLDEPQTFDDKVTLLGYRIWTDAETVTAVTYWRVEAGLPWDLAIFMHLLGAENELLAQDDALDAVPDFLQPGDVFLQLHRLSLPESPPTGPYRLAVGLYTRSDGQRMLLVYQASDYWMLAGSVNFDEIGGNR
jgi:4-amino-4-deoxy-L-arabinose transferase-like glycosyltransferase